ncbi:MAG TPA: hypothetical protein VK002_08350 [Rubricoccaceae bacterium]|nr:hypothetical protein [Rubricoccaceae bacterium]
MPSVTPSRFSFPLGFPLLRARPLDEVGRQRVEALLFAGREAAAVNAYREATNANQRAAEQAVARMKASLDAAT